MTLLLTMLPFYLLGNLHCMGMCGPLVALIGKHRYRYAYFIGRLLSFTLFAVVSAEMGAVLGEILALYQLGALVSLIFGWLILLAGVLMLLGRSLSFGGYFSNVERVIALLLLKDRFFSTFLFGFCTPLLPCGQTLIVFSACALSQNAWTGLINGFAFALLTSPSLYIAMHTQALFRRFRRYEKTVMGGFSILVGLLAICRGLADFELIPHLILSAKYHIVLY